MWIMVIVDVQLNMNNTYILIKLNTRKNNTYGFIFDFDI